MNHLYATLASRTYNLNTFLVILHPFLEQNILNPHMFKLQSAQKLQEVVRDDMVRCAVREFFLYY